MRRPQDSFRLALALALSLVLHAAMLLAHAPREAGVIDNRPSVRLGGTLMSTEISARTPERTRLDAPHQVVPTESQPPEPSSPQATTPSYFLAEQLSLPPRPLQDIDLDLPEARLLTTPGKLLLTLWIDAEGRVVSYQVDAPDLPEEYTTAVAEAFVSVRFTPGEILGRKVGSILKLQVDHQSDPDPQR